MAKKVFQADPDAEIMGDFENGVQVLEYLEDHPGEIDVILTDVKMPEMDGHRLTKLVKSNSRLKDIPVIIFSSLITPEMELKGKEVGADEQLTKPEIGHLVSVMDHLLHYGQQD